MQIQPYLFFNGQCEEALQYYGKALGAKTEMIMRFSESPDPVPPGMLPAGFENKIMHCSFLVGDSRIMASDGCTPGECSFQGFSLAISFDNEADVDRVFHALAEGGKVEMPLTKTFWSPRFGMVKDRYGIGWMVSMEPAEATV